MEKFLLVKINQGSRSKPGPGWECVEFHFRVMTDRSLDAAKGAAIWYLERSGKMPRFNFGVEAHFAEWHKKPEFIYPEQFVL